MEDGWMFNRDANPGRFTTYGPVLLGAALIVILILGKSQAAYTVNGSPSSVGYYGYEEAMSADGNQQYLSFASGVLMDGSDTANVGYDHDGTGHAYDKFIVIDLGQEHILESLRVRSNLSAWHSICQFDVTFSSDGQNFSGKISDPGGGLTVPHENGLLVESDVPVNGIQARYLRLRLLVHGWRYFRIGEINLSVNTLPGQSPLSSMTADDLQTVLAAQVSNPLVDQFGQWTKEEWTGKIHTEQELLDATAAEEARYANTTRDPNLFDQYGGYKNLGISLEPYNADYGGTTLRIQTSTYQGTKSWSMSSPDWTGDTNSTIELCIRVPQALLGQTHAAQLFFGFPRGPNADRRWGLAFGPDRVSDASGAGNGGDYFVDLTTNFRRFRILLTNSEPGYSGGYLKLYDLDSADPTTAVIFDTVPDALTDARILYGDLFSGSVGGTADLVYIAWTNGGDFAPPAEVTWAVEYVAQALPEDSTPAWTEAHNWGYESPHGEVSIIDIGSAPKWRLAKVNGRWWFITPDGYPFIFLGVDGFTCWGYNTVEHPDHPDMSDLFEWLPSKITGDFTSCWTSPSTGIWRFNFHAANLIRYYGAADYYDSMLDINWRRLIDGGFNGLVKFNQAQGPLNDLGKPLPFIKAARPIGSIYTIGARADPWDTGYVSAVEAGVQDLYVTYGTDPYYVGMMTWGEYYYGDDAVQKILADNSGCPSKNAFVDQLQATYVTIEAFNTQCGSSFSAFSELNDTDLNPYAAALESDISNFVLASSDTYYSAWRNAIDQLDPNRLFLGSDLIFGWSWSVRPEWIQGSLPYVDALATDHYTTDPNVLITDYIEAYAEPADLPVMIGEYNVSTTDRGFLPHDGFVNNQVDRGNAYRLLQETYFASPYFVGGGWFTVRDQVLLGRDEDGGGESHNTGLFDTCNLPYYNMIDIMKDTNKKVWRIHAGLDVFLDCDLNEDNYINLADFQILHSYWMDPCPDPGSCAGADLDQSGQVDLVDFSKFSSCWLNCTDWEKPECNPYWWE